MSARSLGYWIGISQRFLAVLFRFEFVDYWPTPKRCAQVYADRPFCFVGYGRHEQIPAHKRERSGVAELHSGFTSMASIGLERQAIREMGIPWSVRIEDTPCPIVGGYFTLPDRSVTLTG
jgi:hypothetical protein